VLNNHKNHSSLLCRLGRLMGANTPTLSHGDVARLLGRAGLEIIEAYPLGVLPASDSHMLVPAFIHRACDAALGRRSVGLELAQDIVYVCGLRGGAGPSARGAPGGRS